MLKNTVFWVLGAFITILMLFMIFYSANSREILAVTSFPIEQVEYSMNETKHLEFLSTVGKTSSGEIIFAFKWKDYGLFTVFQTSGEEARLEKKGLMTRLSEWREEE